MQIKVDSWLAPEMAGYAEVREFQKQMAAKLAYNFGGMGSMGMGQPQLAQAMAEAAKQNFKCGEYRF